MCALRTKAPFANKGDRNTIPDNNSDANSPQASWEKGFPPVTGKPIIKGGVPPRREDINGVLHDVTADVIEINTLVENAVERVDSVLDEITSSPGTAIKEWDANASYTSPCLVARNGSTYVYVSSSTGIDPAGDTAGTHWRPLISVWDTTGKTISTAAASGAGNYGDLWFQYI